MEAQIETQPIIKGTMNVQFEEILSPETLAFITHLELTFREKRKELLKRRKEVQIKLDNDELPRFLKETENIRNTEWQVGPIPADLQDRRTEITGPVERKMIINALNSGAKVFMADFEDSNTPSWENCIQGQINLKEAIRKTIELKAENGKTYKLNEKVAVLKVRPRGWHLDEIHLEIDGEPFSGGIVDFGLYLFHNAHQLLRNGSGPYFYLPKLESHLEARLWNEIFEEAQTYLGLSSGTIKVTVLIETILAAFEMEEIIYELKDHLSALNAGRWDYIFSIIKKFNKNPDFILPDRSEVTMRVPFMRAYTNLLVKTCHKRGAHAIGGMAAFIPNRKNQHINEIALKNVAEDKKLEASNGFDGTWVAHPDLVPVAMAEFDKYLITKPNQKDIKREDVKVKAEDLLNVDIDNFQITDHGLRLNISVAIQYISAWLKGNGAVAINNLMEDAATAEISRAQVWQWMKHKVITREGRLIDLNYFEEVFAQEIDKIKSNPELGIDNESLTTASKLFRDLVLAKDFTEFLTLSAYKLID